MIKITKSRKRAKINKSELNEITSSSRESEIQNNNNNTKENAKNLYNSRQKIIDLLNDNSTIRSEAIYEANKKTTRTENTNA